MKSILLLWLLATCFGIAISADKSHLLIDTAKGVNVETWQADPALLTPTSTGWSVRKYRLHGGRQEGVDVVEVNNGRLRFLVVPTRGMGIWEVTSGDVRLGWQSPVKEIVHPQFVNLESRGGLGWLEGFGEWMVRCGLEFAGHPGKDRFVNNVGEQAEMQLTLHGKIGNIPASRVEVVIEDRQPAVIHVRGRVEERMFYGPKLELTTDISTEVGSSSLRILDRVKNHGAFDQEFQLIYHANYGPPLLNEGAKFVGPVRRVTPFNSRAAEGLEGYDRYPAPKLGFIEQVYCLVPWADEQGQTRIMLQDPTGTKAVSMGFSVEQLPFLTLWKNTNAVEEGYVTGLEPGTGYAYNRRIERHFGRVPRLKPGEEREFALQVAILEGRQAVTDSAEEIRRIQAGRETKVDREPPVLPE